MTGRGARITSTYWTRKGTSLLDKEGNVVTRDEKKAEVPRCSIVRQDALRPSVGGIREQSNPLIIQEEAVRDLLSLLDLHKFVGPDGIYPRVDKIAGR